MKFASIRMITEDVDRLIGFYEELTGVSAVRYTPAFAELHYGSFSIAIGHTETVAVFGSDSARPADNHSLIVEFMVDDVDAEFDRLGGSSRDWVQEPTTMPWGNRSVLLRDPDGSLVNLFTPVTPEAIAKFGEREA